MSAGRGGRAALACLALALCSALVVASAPPAAADPGPPVPTTPPPPAATSPPPVPLTPPSGDSADDGKSDTIPETVLGPTPKWGIDRRRSATRICMTAAGATACRRWARAAIDKENLR